MDSGEKVGVRKKSERLNTVSWEVWGQRNLLWIAQSLEMEIASGGKEMIKSHYMQMLMLSSRTKWP